MNFAIVDDSRSQSEVLKALLKGEGHQVDVYAGGAEILSVLGTRPVDFVVLSRELPDMPGEAVLQGIRDSQGWDVPVLMSTLSATEEVVADLLRQGADDCVGKPVRYLEFMARVDALVRRCRRAPQNSLRIGGIEIDLEGRRIRLSGQQVELTQREYDLAVVLMRNVGRVLPREELLASVWTRDSEIDTRTVDTHASRLRKKLGLGGESGLMLTSVYGQGYRLDTVQGV